MVVQGWQAHGSERMAMMIEPQQVPLREDEGGTLRVGDSRVSLDSVFLAYQQGAIPETIVEMYPGLALADIYAVIAFCLKNRAFVEDYLARRAEAADRVRQSVRARPDHQAFRDRLHQRAREKGLR